MPKTIPDGVSLRGLSAADLVVLLAYHGPASRRVRFYRDHLFLLWWEKTHSPGAVLKRWMGLNEKTRAWIMPFSASLQETSIYPAVHVALQERGKDWVLRPDADDGCNAPKRPRQRTSREKEGAWYRNRLWLNWYETIEAPTYRRPQAFAAEWAKVPTEAKRILKPALAAGFGQPHPGLCTFGRLPVGTDLIPGTGRYGMVGQLEETG